MAEAKGLTKTVKIPEKMSEAIAILGFQQTITFQKLVWRGLYLAYKDAIENVNWDQSPVQRKSQKLTTEWLDASLLDGSNDDRIR